MLSSAEAATSSMVLARPGDDAAGGARSGCEAGAENLSSSVSGGRGAACATAVCPAAAGDGGCSGVASAARALLAVMLMTLMTLMIVAADRARPFRGLITIRFSSFKREAVIDTALHP